MHIQNETLYIAHVFVFTNDRGGERKSCADSHSQLGIAILQRDKKLLLDASAFSIR